MTEPTPKPTVASLQRELADMAKQSALNKQRSQEHAQIHEEQAETIAQVRADLAPLLDYFAKDWLGPAAGNYRRLKAFVEGK